MLYVYEKGEISIKKFIDYQNDFREWEILAQNIDEVQKRCETRIELTSDRKSHISLIPTRKESINKINNTQAKEGFIRLVSQFQSIIFVSLRKMLKQQFDNVQEFVTKGMELVQGNLDKFEAIILV